MSLVLLAAVLALSAWVSRPLLGHLGTGVLVHLVRLPGNLLHELAHAVAMLVCGYTIAGFRVSLFDPAGRGHVVPGPAWLPITRPWVANLVSPIAPVFAGIGALWWLSGYVVGWRDPWTWAAVGVAFPVLAELCPSDVDLRAWIVPALLVGAPVAALGWWKPELLAPLAVLDAPAAAWLLPALRTGAIATAAWAPVCWGVGWVRR